jgi:hypothetical protein
MHNNKNENTIINPKTKTLYCSFSNYPKETISTTTNTLKKQKRKIKTSTTPTTKILVHQRFSKDSRVSSGISQEH